MPISKLVRTPVQPLIYYIFISDFVMFYIYLIVSITIFDNRVLFMSKIYLNYLYFWN
jgi:hypothetical protein